jgi:hypothetical protein
MSSNDNDPSARGPTAPLPDPHGHAALLLVESLIHGLLGRSMISVADAIEIVETADSVQVEVAEAADGYGAPMWRSHALLKAIADSLKLDLDSGPTTPIRPVP